MTKSSYRKPFGNPWLINTKCLNSKHWLWGFVYNCDSWLFQIRIIEAKLIIQSCCFMKAFVWAPKTCSCTHKYVRVSITIPCFDLIVHKYGINITIGKTQKMSSRNHEPGNQIYMNSVQKLHQEDCSYKKKPMKSFLCHINLSLFIQDSKNASNKIMQSLASCICGFAGTYCITRKWRKDKCWEFIKWPTEESHSKDDKSITMPQEYFDMERGWCNSIGKKDLII